MLTKEHRVLLHDKTEVEREAIFGEWAKTWIAEHPGRYLQLCGIRFVKSVWIDWDNPKGWNPVYMGTRTLLGVLTLAGLVLAFRRWPTWRLVMPLTVWGIALLTYTLTIAASRFGIAFEPMQMVLSAAVVVAVARWALVPDASLAEPRSASASSEGRVVA